MIKFYLKRGACPEAAKEKTPTAPKAAQIVIAKPMNASFTLKSDFTLSHLESF